MRFADLHLHTHHSDGTRSPREVVDLAVKHGLAIIAISDHDNIAAYFEAAEYARSRSVTLVPATELSCGHEGGDIHVLAYAFDPHDERIGERLLRFREVRHQRGYAMVDRLRNLGYAISAERVEQLAGGGAMGRPHVARALVERGYVASIGEAFDTLLGEGRPAWVGKARFDVDEAVSLVHAAGGVLSIAHPVHYRDPDRTVADLLDMGVDAVEVHHPDVDDQSAERFRSIARFRGRFVTGGSDDHGTAKEVETIGTVRVPETLIGPILERL